MCGSNLVTFLIMLFDYLSEWASAVVLSLSERVSPLLQYIKNGFQRFIDQTCTVCIVYYFSVLNTTKSRVKTNIFGVCISVLV